MNEEKWYNIIRVVHLDGGLRARNQGSDVCINLGGDDCLLNTSINRYHDLSSVLISLGFKIIGIDYSSPKSVAGSNRPQSLVQQQTNSGSDLGLLYYMSHEQLIGYDPPFWHPSNWNSVGNDLSFAVENQWGGLANAAFNKKILN
jgi:hypothetical protein